MIYRYHYKQLSSSTSNIKNHKRLWHIRMIGSSLIYLVRSVTTTFSCCVKIQSKKLPLHSLEHYMSRKKSDNHQQLACRCTPSVCLFPSGVSTSSRFLSPMLGAESLMNTSWWKFKDNIILGPEPQASQAGVRTQKGEGLCCSRPSMCPSVWCVCVGGR